MRALEYCCPFNEHQVLVSIRLNTGLFVRINRKNPLRINTYRQDHEKKSLKMKKVDGFIPPQRNQQSMNAFKLLFLKELEGLRAGWSSL